MADPFAELAERLKLLSLKQDGEWIDLHGWAREFRQRHGLTLKQFLILCKVGENDKSLNTFVQFLSGSGSRAPSNRDGTVGKRLRDILSVAKLDPNIEKEATESPRASPAELIENAWSEFYDEFTKFGIASLSVDHETTPEVTVTAHIARKMEENAVAELLMERAKLGFAPKMKLIHVQYLSSGVQSRGLGS